MYNRNIIFAKIFSTLNILCTMVHLDSKVTSAHFGRQVGVNSNQWLYFLCSYIFSF